MEFLVLSHGIQTFHSGIPRRAPKKDLYFILYYIHIHSYYTIIFHIDILNTIYSLYIDEIFLYVCIKIHLSVYVYCVYTKTLEKEEKISGYLFNPMFKTSFL
jgi:hypothetical protein